MRRVELMTLGTAALIVADESGVMYANQVGGGNFCFQRELEGVLVPCEVGLSMDSYETSVTFMLEEVFRNAGADPIRTLSDPSIIADQVDRILTDSVLLKWISVDRTRLGESMNGWVYVELNLDEAVYLQGFDSTWGVLTWGGSD